MSINTLMETWSRQAEAMGEFHRQELRETGPAWETLLLHGLKNAPGNRVLDAGCGTGFLALLLARNGWYVTAIDASTAMIEQGLRMAKEMGLTEFVTFQVGDVQTIDLPDNTFDAVVSRHASWLFQDPENAYRTWVRLLRPGGILLNMDANWLLPLWESEATAQFWADEAELVRRYGPFQDFYHDRDMMDTLRCVPLAFQERPAWDEALCRELGLGVESDFLPGEPYWNSFLALRYRTMPTFMLRAQKPTEEMKGDENGKEERE